MRTNNEDGQDFEKAKKTFDAAYHDLPPSSPGSPGSPEKEPPGPGPQAKSQVKKAIVGRLVLWGMFLVFLLLFMVYFLRFSHPDFSWRDFFSPHAWHKILHPEEGKGDASGSMAQGMGPSGAQPGMEAPSSYGEMGTPGQAGSGGPYQTPRDHSTYGSPPAPLPNGGSFASSTNAPTTIATPPPTEAMPPVGSPEESDAPSEVMKTRAALIRTASDLALLQALQKLHQAVLSSDPGEAEEAFLVVEDLVQRLRKQGFLGKNPSLEALLQNKQQLLKSLSIMREQGPASWVLMEAFDARERAQNALAAKKEESQPFGQKLLSALGIRRVSKEDAEEAQRFKDAAQNEKEERDQVIKAFLSAIEEQDETLFANLLEEHKGVFSQEALHVMKAYSFWLQFLDDLGTVSRTIPVLVPASEGSGGAESSSLAQPSSSPSLQTVLP